MPEKFTEVELRIQELKVKKQGFWESLVKESKFEVKLFSVVSDGIPDNAFNLDLGIFPVREGGSIDFGPNGYALYRNRAGQIPRYLDCNVSVIEDDSDIRNMAKLMSEIRKTDDFKSLVGTLVLTAANPALRIGLDVAGSILGIGLDILKQNSDDLWLQQYFSFNYKIDGYDGIFEVDSNEVKLKLEIVTA